MKIDITERLKVPEGITVGIDKDIIKLKGPRGSNEKKMFHPRVKIEINDGIVELKSKKATKNEKTILNTLKAHIRNLMRGVNEGYEYRLKICSGHFPINVSIQNNELIIKNFFGEKKPRKIKIPKNVEVNIEGDIIKVTGVDINLISQTASKMEQATRRTGFDRRVYQDGLWIIKKAK
jgi:large subunit ribosomal protein L6